MPALPTVDARGLPQIQTTQPTHGKTSGQLKRARAKTNERIAGVVAGVLVFGGIFACCGGILLIPTPLQQAAGPTSPQQVTTSRGIFDFDGDEVKRVLDGTVGDWRQLDTVTKQQLCLYVIWGLYENDSLNADLADSLDRLGPVGTGNREQMVISAMVPVAVSLMQAFDTFAVAKGGPVGQAEWDTMRMHDAMALVLSTGYAKKGIPVY